MVSEIGHPSIVCPFEVSEGRCFFLFILLLFLFFIIFYTVRFVLIKISKQ